MNNKILGIVLLLLLGIYGATQMFSGKTESSYKSEIVEIDPATVTLMKIYNKADNMEEVLLKKEGENWTASKGGLTVAAKEDAISSMLSMLELIKAKRIASKSKDKWKDFEVEEGAGNRLMVYAGDKLLSDLYVGRFQFNQQAQQSRQAPSGTSYLRLGGADNVYALDGFLSMSLGQGFNSFRNKSLVKLDKAQISGFSVKAEKGNYSCTKVGNIWQTGEGVKLDSTKVANYINALAAVNGGDFVDDVNKAELTSLPTQSVTIQTSEKPNPVVLNCYFKEGEAKPYIIHSSENDAYFLSDDKGIPVRVFKALDDLIP